MPLVKKAKEMSVKSICFAWEEGAVCKDVCDRFYPVSTVDKEEVLRICREIGIDGITTIASDVAVLTVNYVAEKMGLIGNSDNYSETATNKYLMRQCFMEHHVPSPKFCLTVGEIPEEVHAFRFPVIVKPTDRSGSRGVEKADDANELQAAIERACKESFQKKAVIEEFVEGREISVESISYKGEHYVLQITDKVTTEAPFFVELEHHQPSTLLNGIKQRVKEIVLKHHEKLDGSGYPSKLFGNKIPYEVQVVTVADVFSALTEDRVYHKAFSLSDSIRILEETPGLNLVIVDTLKNFKLTAKRMEISHLKNNITIINDSYNASFESMKASILSFK